MGVPIIPLTLVGELCAALRAAAGENLAAVAGGHSVAEAAFLGIVDLLGLISAFHESITSLIGDTLSIIQQKTTGCQPICSKLF